MTMEEVYLALAKDIPKVGVDGHLRFWTSGDVVKHKKEFNSKYATQTILPAVKDTKAKGTTMSKKLITYEKLDSFHITPENISDLVMNKVKLLEDLNVELATLELELKQSMMECKI